MALLTLLSVVNTTLDYFDSFKVSTIDDTIESQQVTGIAEKVYNDLIDDVFNNTLNQKLFQLESLADITKPNYLKLPSTALRIKESQVMYNVATGVTGTTTLNLKKIPYERPQDFLQLIGSRSTNQTNTQIVTDFSGHRMVIQNKTAPKYFTSFDDEYLVFDSFDSDVDSTLQSSKSTILASSQGSFTRSDTFLIDFPEWFHSIYLNAVIAEASEVLRGEPIFSVARKARLGILKARKKQRIGSEGINTKRRTYGR